MEKSHPCISNSAFGLMTVFVSGKSLLPLHVVIKGPLRFPYLCLRPQNLRRLQKSINGSYSLISLGLRRYATKNDTLAIAYVFRWFFCFSTESAIISLTKIYLHQMFPKEVMSLSTTLISSLLCFRRAAHPLAEGEIKMLVHRPYYSLRI
ncbi:hypothetical protein J6590_059815 [Homalodisca vitripennis]|nr:hypothetical protein J6590_059815 [Homalodisca vitripennis]